MCRSYTDLHFNHKQNHISPVPAALPGVFPTVDISVMCFVNFVANLNRGIIVKILITNIYSALNSTFLTLCTLHKLPNS